MRMLSRTAALFVLVFPLLLAGCGGPTDGPRSESRPTPQPKAEAKTAPGPESQAKAAPADAKPAADTEEEAEVKTNLAKLDPADQKLAEAQRFCAIDDEHRLGAMGKPVKLTIQGKPVFLCCNGCRKQALAEPDKTLAKVEELKQKAATATK
jgi:hypothetical protein